MKGDRRVERKSIAPFWDAPNGVCRICGKKVKKPRRRWCSQRCIAEFNSQAWSARGLAWHRDKGICANCGVDCEAVELALRKLGHAVSARYWESDALDALMREMGSTAKNVFGTFWDADHILPVSEGGLTTKENVRTLCKRCHRAETKALAARRAKLKASGRSN